MRKVILGLIAVLLSTSVAQAYPHSSFLNHETSLCDSAIKTSYDQGIAVDCASAARMWVDASNYETTKRARFATQTMGAVYLVEAGLAQFRLHNPSKGADEIESAKVIFRDDLSHATDYRVIRIAKNEMNRLSNIYLSSYVKF